MKLRMIVVGILGCLLSTLVYSAGATYANIIIKASKNLDVNVEVMNPHYYYQWKINYRSPPDVNNYFKSFGDQYPEDPVKITKFEIKDPSTQKVIVPEFYGCNFDKYFEVMYIDIDGTDPSVQVSCIYLSRPHEININER